MSSVSIKVTILGSGTSTGVPVPGCRCPVCISPDPKNKRTRCSALLNWNGRNILIDTATDLRQQVLRERIEQIDAVLFTHIHADHVHGIDDLRPFNPANGESIPVYGSAETIVSLRRNFAYIFTPNASGGYRPRLESRMIEEDFELFDLKVQPLLLQHGDGTSLGYRVGPLAYLADCNGIPSAARRELYGLELLIIDALRFRPHATHFTINEALAAASDLRARRTLLTHLSHDVDYQRDGTDLPPDTEFAYDGQTIELFL